MTPERIAAEFFETSKRLNTPDAADTWDEAPQSTKDLLTAVVKDLIERHILLPAGPLPPLAREKRARHYGTQVVQSLADVRGHGTINGWLIVYAYPSGNGLGIGSVSSGDAAWEAAKRLTEKNLAAYLLEALRYENARNNGLILP